MSNIFAKKFKFLPIGSKDTEDKNFDIDTKWLSVILTRERSNMRSAHRLITIIISAKEY
jgi:hypothetical protein